MRFLYAMVGHMGMPSFMFTFAPDDVYGVLNIRLSMPLTDNVQFPACDDGLIDALAGNQNEFRTIQIKKPNLKALIANDPVATAEVYRLMMHAIFKTCLRMSPEDKARRSDPLNTKQPGMIGKIHGAFGVNEAQARGALHMHLLIWGGLPPSLLHYSGSIPRLKHEIIKQLDLMLQAHLSPETHVQGMLSELKSITPIRPALIDCSNPYGNPLQFSKDVETIAITNNLHKHTKTCRKGNIGSKQCRLGIPRSLHVSTGVEYLVPTIQQLTNEITYDTFDEPLPTPIECLPNRCFSKVPVAFRNPNIAYWDLKRPQFDFIPGEMDLIHPPGEGQQATDEDTALYEAQCAEIACRLSSKLTAEEAQVEWRKLEQEIFELPEHDKDRLQRAFPTRNGLVVEFSPVLTAAIGCNTNLSFLGSEAQAKATICYILKYLTKPPAELAHSLSLLYKARKTIELYPSVAENTGESMRTAQHYLNRIVNQETSSQEVSAEMAAAAMVGMTSEVCTHGFITVHVSAALDYAVRHPIVDTNNVDEFADLECDRELEQTKNKEKETNSDLDIEDTNTDFNSITICAQDREEEPYMLNLPEPSGTEDTDDIITPVTVYKLPNGNQAVPDHEHYSFRGKDLRHLSLYEYKSIVVVKPKKKTGTTLQSAADKRPQIQEDISDFIQNIGEEIQECVEPDFRLQQHPVGRPENTCFEFDTNCSLHVSHYQQLRSKHKIPILIKRPPRPPPPKPDVLNLKWCKQARHFAQYYLTLFRPWFHIHPTGKGTHPGLITWHELCKFMKDLEFGTNSQPPTIVQTVTRRWIEQQSQGMRVTAEERTVCRNRRNINATKWGVYDGSEPLKSKPTREHCNSRE